MNFSNLMLFIPVLLVSMTVHEAAHALMSNSLGDDTAKREGRLSLNPLVHIDPIFTVLVPAVMIFLGASPILAAKPVPFNPDRVKFGEFGAALVGLAGPVSNIVMAIIAAVYARTIGLTSQLAADILTLFVVVNINLFVFNLIPWPPLDGSRLLYAFAPDAVRRVMRQIEAFGITGIFVFIFVAYPVVAPITNLAKDRLLSGVLGI